jgi:hypothetical protein
MVLQGFKLTEWVYLFDEKNKQALNRIVTNKKNKDIKHEFLTWQLITVLLPVVTFLFVFIFNMATTNFFKFGLAVSVNKAISIFNNGSLPIISFGILTSGMPYLLEQLKVYPEYHIIRRRVMAVSLTFLFLSASLYVIQTLNILNNKLNLFTSILIIASSIYVFFFACSIGFKMYLLQSSNVSEFDEDIREGVNDLSNSTDDI